MRTQAQGCTTHTGTLSFLLTVSFPAQRGTRTHRKRRETRVAVPLSVSNVVFGLFASLSSSTRRFVGCVYTVTMNAHGKPNVSSSSVSTGGRDAVFSLVLDGLPPALLGALRAAELDPASNAFREACFCAR